MKIKKSPSKRLLKMKPPKEKTPEQKALDSQEAKIAMHPKINVIHEAFEEGVKSTEIARWFAEEGWLPHTVNENTFLQYLRKYKRKYPLLSSGGRTGTIDALVSAHKPDADMLVELQRMLRLQKLRLGVEVKTELDMGKLFNSTPKEIEVTLKIMEMIAKVQGRLNQDSMSGVNMAITNSSDDLVSIQKDEANRQRMTDLSKELAKYATKAKKQSVKAS